MSVKVYHAGQWYYLYNSNTGLVKVYHNGAWYQLTAHDHIYHQGAWYLLGDPIYEHDQYGWFPAKVYLTTYECTADTAEDPETGDTIYSNWRWQFMSTDVGIHSPGLENPAEYPQWRYYTVGEQGQSPFDFSVEVNVSNGHIIGYGSDLHNPQANTPPPPAAGLDYFWDTVTYVSAISQF